MRFPHSVGFWAYPEAGFTVFTRPSLPESSGKLIVRPGIWSCFQRSGRFSKPVRSVTDPSVSIRCRQVIICNHREEELLADGEVVSERRVARIMRKNRISPRLTKRKKPVTTDSNHKMSPSPNRAYPVNADAHYM
jgi:hypothetical protein